MALAQRFSLWGEGNRVWNKEKKTDFCLEGNARRETTSTRIKENLWGFVWCWIVKKEEENTAREERENRCRLLEDSQGELLEKEKDKEKKAREERPKCCHLLENSQGELRGKEKEEEKKVRKERAKCC